MARVSKASGDQFYLLHPDRKGTLMLPVPIDAKVMDKLNARIAAISSEKLDLESEKKRTLEPINKRLSELRLSEQKLNAEKKSGETLAEVEVQERANFEEGCAWMVRTDTGLEVPNTRRPLTQAERSTFAAPAGDSDAERLFPRRGSATTEEEEDAEDSEDDGEGGDEEGDDANEPIPFGDPSPVATPPLPPMPGETVSDVPAEAGAEPRVGRLYSPSSHAGWGFYVHDGHVYFRGPNVDSFEPAGRAGDFGPFAWVEKDKMLDALDSAVTADKAWMDTHAKLLEDADRAILNGTVKERVNTLTRGAAPEAPSPDAVADPETVPEPSGMPEDGPTSEEPGAAAGATGSSALESWKKLSDAARKVMRYLGTVPSADTTVIGNKTGTKAGAVVPALVGKGYAEHQAEPKTPAHYALTPLGRELLAAADAAKAGAKPSTGPAASAPQTDVPY